MITLRSLRSVPLAALLTGEVNRYLVTRVFESRDASHDGRLTKAERLAGPDPRREKLFAQRDSNKDGVVALEEALAYGNKKGAAKKLVREADGNKDGVLSCEEVSTCYGSKEGAPN